MNNNYKYLFSNSFVITVNAQKTTQEDERVVLLILCALVAAENAFILPLNAKLGNTYDKMSCDIPLNVLANGKLGSCGTFPRPLSTFKGFMVKTCWGGKDTNTSV